MSDLSVLDVQKMLREHADFGHDVLQHPKQSIIQGKPYGMRSLAHLVVSGSGKDMDSGLTSHILQSERPLLSSISTNPRQNGIEVYPLLPHRARYGSHENEFYTLIENNPELHPHTEYSTTLDIPNGAKTVHEALQAHTTASFPYVGTEFTDKGPDPGGVTYHYKNFGDFSPALNFHNLLKNTQRYTGHDPFSGIITVYHHPQHTAYDVYGYDPSTEQLIRRTP